MINKLIYDYIEYDKKTGVFKWTKQLGRKTLPGKIAGCINDQGYVVIRFDGVRYPAHWLAWDICVGIRNKIEIDHINGIRSDNRIENLRIVNHRANMINQKCHRNGKLPGAFYVERKNKWRVRIRINGVATSLGYFYSESDAHEAYMKKYNEIEGIV